MLGIFFSCCVPIVHGVHCSAGVQKKCQNFFALLSLFIKSSIVLFTAIKRFLTVATIFLILFHPVKLLLAFFFGRESWELFSCDSMFLSANAYLWYCAWRKLNSSLILSQFSVTVNLNGCVCCGGPWKRWKKWWKLVVFTSKTVWIFSPHSRFFLLKCEPVSKFPILYSSPCCKINNSVEEMGGVRQRRTKNDFHRWSNIFPAQSFAHC